MCNQTQFHQTAYQLLITIVIGQSKGVMPPLLLLSVSSVLFIRPQRAANT